MADQTVVQILAGNTITTSTITTAGTEAFYAVQTPSGTPTNAALTFNTLKYYMSQSAVLVAPSLGTPVSGVLTNATGLPASGVVGTAAILGANVFTALQTITQSTVNTSVFVSTGYSLTGSGTASMINLAGTLNTTGAPSAIKINITVTSAGLNSRILDILDGGAQKFGIDVSGNIALGAINGNNAPAYKIDYTTNSALSFVGGSTRASTFSSYYALIVKNEAYIAIESSLPIQWGNTQTLSMDTTIKRVAAGALQTDSDFIVGTAAISTASTTGFLYIPTCAGAPTGTPVSYTGRIPMIYDTTNDQFWFYRSGWKQPKTPAGAAIVTWQ